MKTTFESMASFADAEAEAFICGAAREVERDTAEAEAPIPALRADPQGRRMFLKTFGGGIVGAAALATAIGRGNAAPSPFAPLWRSAQVLVGNSQADQSPSQMINCPMFFIDGRFADAFHTLDLSLLRMTGKVRGTITLHNDTIELDFAPSVAAAIAQGTDGPLYLLVGGECKVSAGTGPFHNVSRAIARCKYKAVVDKQGDILLIACVDCILILVRDRGADDDNQRG